MLQLIIPAYTYTIILTVIAGIQGGKNLKQLLTSHPQSRVERKGCVCACHYSAHRLHFYTIQNQIQGMISPIVAGLPMPINIIKTTLYKPTQSRHTLLRFSSDSRFCEVDKTKPYTHLDELYPQTVVKLNAFSLKLLF